MPEGGKRQKKGQHNQGWKRRQSHSAMEEVSETTAQAGPVPVGAVLPVASQAKASEAEALPREAPAPEEVNVEMKLMVKNYGVLGHSDKGQKESPPGEDIVLVDPAGLPFIHGDKGPSDAKGAAQANYKWLEISEAESFPLEVKEAITKECQAKYYAYGKKKCIHVVGPDLRQSSDKDDAVEKLAIAYRNVFEEFCNVGMLQGLRLRLLPISGGVFSGAFKQDLPEMTACAVKTAFHQLSGAKQQHLNASSELCIFMESEFDKFALAFGQAPIKKEEPVPPPVEDDMTPPPVEDTEPEPQIQEPNLLEKIQERARLGLGHTRAVVEHAQLKAKTLAKDPHVHYSAVGAGAGAAIVGAGGAATGLTTGSLLGAAVGVVPALFTFGLSIPICAAVGGGAGLAVGAATGATAGALAGGATGYGAYSHRHEIRASASKTLEKVTNRAELVKARANAATNAATSFLSESATVARARLMGGGTGGTEAHD